MAVTVQMIENKEFTKQPLGYNKKEVDEFLDEIADEMEAMTNEIQSLRMRLSQASQPGTQAKPLRGEAPAPLDLSAPLITPPAEVREEPMARPAPAAEVPEVKEVQEKREPLRTDIGTEAAGMLRTAQRVYDETIRDAKDEAKRIVDEAQRKKEEETRLLEKEREETEIALNTLRASAAEYKRKLQNLLDSQQKLLDDASSLFEESEEKQSET